MTASMIPMAAVVAQEDDFVPGEVELACEPAVDDSQHRAVGGDRDDPGAPWTDRLPFAVVREHRLDERCEVVDRAGTALGDQLPAVCATARKRPFDGGVATTSIPAETARATSSASGISGSTAIAALTASPTAWVT